MGNHMPNKVWDEFAYPFPNFKGCTMAKWFHLPQYNGCKYLSILGLKLIRVSKKAPRSRQNAFLMKLPYFELKFTEVYHFGSNEWYVSIGPDSGLAPTGDKPLSVPLMELNDANLRHTPWMDCCSTLVVDFPAQHCGAVSFGLFDACTHRFIFALTPARAYDIMCI